MRLKKRRGPQVVGASGFERGKGTQRLRQLCSCRRRGASDAIGHMQPGEFHAAKRGALAWRWRSVLVGFSRLPDSAS